jgi:hypothetical protein
MFEEHLETNIGDQKDKILSHVLLCQHLAWLIHPEDGGRMFL